MNSRLKLWKKQEKRIVKLLYRKDLLGIDINELYWNEYAPTGKKYKFDKYRFPEYFDELHYCTTDYWGYQLLQPNLGNIQ